MDPKSQLLKNTAVEQTAGSKVGEDAEAKFLDDRFMVDTLFDGKLEAISAFKFDNSVALAFDDMALRSIPLYPELQRLTARVIEHYSLPNTRIYDLGCSTGTTLLCIASRLRDPTIELIGIDNSTAMLERCKSRLTKHGLADRITLEEADILNYPLSGASAVVAHYVLQFLPVSHRLPLLRSIRAALEPGGVLLVSEKATHGDSVLDSITTGLYYDFKRRNGYSELEIAQKREALENVLVPLSVKLTTELLKEAGFARVELLSKCFQFCSFIAYNASN